MTTLLRPKLPRTRPDASVENHGSIFLVRPISYAAAQWIDEHVGPHQTFGDAVVVEHRYICDLIDGMQADGLEVAR